MKTRNLPIIISLLSLSLAISSRAQAQYEYHYSYGGSRVVQQDDIGLNRPSGTYIGTGTLSKSAQGVQEVGAQVNPGLPRVNHGAYIGTPGDNLYGAHPILSPAEEQQERLQALQQQRRRIGAQRQRVQQPEQQKGFLYQPGENLRAGSGAYMAYPTLDSGHSTAIYNPQALDTSTSTDVSPPKASQRRY